MTRRLRLENDLVGNPSRLMLDPTIRAVEFEQDPIVTCSKLNAASPLDRLLRGWASADGSL